MRNAMKSRAGFTLIELMTAMVIMAVGLFAIIHLQVVSLRASGYARERTEAYGIAMGVAEELRAKGLTWVNQKGIPSASEQTLDQVTGLTSVAAPSAGSSLGTDTSMMALTDYTGKTVSAGPAIAGAYGINVNGDSVDTLGAGLGSARSVYRIHYVAHPVRLQATDPNPVDDLSRVSIVVSWDNKDHGEQDFDWNAWQANFWDRHMVVVTTYLAKIRNW